jgi:hypothetical protein
MYSNHYKMIIKMTVMFVCDDALGDGYPKVVKGIRVVSCLKYIGYLFKYLLKVGVEGSIVNAPLVSLQSKNTNNAKWLEVRLK